ncbi:alpha/beta hydrolase fold domain-containing protein [Kineococcus arenarius]|uniref:alpha/beta hydrolase fold domain-containing protein n=1 Tax=Kineococcus sp. SYSU DK007 TaxID=3383128 RepID=UPI003D7C8DF2
MSDEAPTRSGLVFAERDGSPLLMDLVLPAGAGGPSGPPPVVVWLHGGGWFTGDRHLAPDLTRFFAARGIAMASIEYRLSGQALFPAQLHDVRAAVRHLRREASALGVDGTRIGLWGSSAGGHLAALAGVTGHVRVLPGERVGDDEPGADVQAVAEGYGPVDLERVVADSSGSAPPAMSGANAPEARLLGGPPAERPEAARAASPLTHVTAAAPPFQIAHGTADVLVRCDQSVLLHEALVAAGVESTLHLLDGYRHGFLNPAGAVEVPGPRVFDDGRLEREGGAPSTVREFLPGRGERSGPATFSFDEVGDFLARHLLGEETA